LQVFSQDKSIYEAVESAFIAIYTKRIPTETAKSLINLNIDCSIGDLAALENLVSSLVLKGEISSSTVHSSFLLMFAMCNLVNGNMFLFILVATVMLITLLFLHMEFHV
jgi:hypothetical protein